MSVEKRIRYLKKRLESASPDPIAVAKIKKALADVEDLREYLQGKQVIDTETHVATDSTVVVDKALIQDLIDYAEKHKAAEPWMVDKMKAMLKASEEDA